MPDRILCSTAIRCRETWHGVAEGLASTLTVDFEEDLYNASPGELLDCLAGVVDARCVLLLAHNPGVSVLALELCASGGDGAERMRRGFAPASIASFSFEGPWSLLSTTSLRLTLFETIQDR